MAAGFELKGGNGKFSWNLRARNGRVILTSERYNTKAAAEKGIESVRRHATVPKNFEPRQAKNGAPYFVLLSRNKQVIGTSEMYTSNSGRQTGIASVAVNAPDAPIHDNTK